MPDPVPLAACSDSQGEKAGREEGPVGGLTDNPFPEESASQA